MCGCRGVSGVLANCVCGLAAPPARPLTLARWALLQRTFREIMFLQELHEHENIIKCVRVQVVEERRGGWDEPRRFILPAAPVCAGC